jgi:hypothetical protein
MRTGLDYPTLWDLSQGEQGKSPEMGIDLATQWKVAQVQEDPTKDVEQLTFLTPLTLYWSPGAGGGASALHASSTGNHPLSRLVFVSGKAILFNGF